jgi:hypothetical protein
MSERKNSSITVRAASGSVRRFTQNMNMLRRWILAPATLAALVFVSAGPSRAQSQTAASKPAVGGVVASTEVTAANAATPAQTATPRPDFEAAAPNGQHEGITVHGYWTIEVRNPDGSVVKHVEFENSLLATTGAPLLTALMLGQNSPGAWAIGLIPISVGGGGLLCNKPITITNGFVPGATTGVETCVIAGSGDQYFQTCSSANGCFSTAPNGLAAPTAAFQNGVSTLTLMGQMTAETSGTIAGAFTMLMTCSSSVTPTACPTTAPPSPATWDSLPPLLTQEYISGTPPSIIPSQFPFGIPVTEKDFAFTSCGGTNQPLCYVTVAPQQVVSVSVQLSFQ